LFDIYSPILWTTDTSCKPTGNVRRPMHTPNSTIDSKYLKTINAILSYSIDRPNAHPTVIRAQASMAKAPSIRSYIPLSPRSNKARSESKRMRSEWWV
jgi:hypothetical protein